MAGEPRFPHPIFVGGSARSGTHVMGRLIGADPRYHAIEVEARFHCADGGLTDLLEGRTRLERFCRQLLGPWWQRGLREHTGLQRIIAREELEAAAERFRERFPDQPWDASRELADRVLGTRARAHGKPSWVEVSGGNIRSSPTLLRLFDRARFVHMARDGRAVTAALLRKRDTTDDLELAFRHWDSRVRHADAALRQLPPETAITVFLESLTTHDRNRTLGRLLELLEVEDPAPIRGFFERKISGERAHTGRWRERMAPADARWVDRRYRRRVRRLRRQGVDWIPEPRDGPPSWPTRLLGRARLRGRS